MLDLLLCLLGPFLPGPFGFGAKRRARKAIARIEAGERVPLRAAFLWSTPRRHHTVVGTLEVESERLHWRPGEGLYSVPLAQVGSLECRSGRGATKADWREYKVPRFYVVLEFFDVEKTFFVALNEDVVPVLRHVLGDRWEGRELTG